MYKIKDILKSVMPLFQQKWCMFLIVHGESIYNCYLDLVFLDRIKNPFKDRKKRQSNRESHSAANFAN